MVWPTATALSARDIPFCLLTDRDRMTDDVDGEGDPFILAQKRNQTFGSYGMTVVESSPGRPIEKEGWTPPEDEPHMAPPATGIVAIYNRGSRGRWYFRCPDCGEDFEPRFNRLIFPKEGSNAARAAGVELSCSCCGSMIGERHKRELNANGRWFARKRRRRPGPGGRTDPAGRYRVLLDTGPAAAFQTWTELVRKYLDAIDDWRKTGDETTLKSVTNLDVGESYLPRAMRAKRT